MDLANAVLVPRILIRLISLISKIRFTGSISLIALVSLIVPLILINLLIISLLIRDRVDLIHS